MPIKWEVDVTRQSHSLIVSLYDSDRKWNHWAPYKLIHQLLIYGPTAADARIQCKTRLQITHSHHLSLQDKTADVSQ